MLADKTKNVLLRCPNKENTTGIRPDAIMSIVVQHLGSFGFGKVELGGHQSLP
jgi:hypothetical protein